jgi:hypothetical protein
LGYQVIENLVAGETTPRKEKCHAERKKETVAGVHAHCRSAH